MGSYGDEVKNLAALIGIHGELMGVFAMLEQSRDIIRVYVGCGSFAAVRSTSGSAGSAAA